MSYIWRFGNGRQNAKSACFINVKSTTQEDRRGAEEPRNDISMSLHLFALKASDLFLMV